MPIYHPCPRLDDPQAHPARVARFVASWPNSRIASIRLAVEKAPHIDRVVNGERYREWAWNGAIYTATPARAATCAACGNKIAGGTRALFAVHSEGKNGPWAPEKRYLHIECVGVVL